MQLRRCCTALLLAAGCGRFGVRDLLLDAGPGSHYGAADASGAPDASAFDAARPDAGHADSGLAREAGVDASSSGMSDSGIHRGRDSGMDASSRDATIDATHGLDAAMDASRALDASGALDAAMKLDSGTDARTPPMCEGQLVFGLCWYLARADTSCNDACAIHSGFDTRALGYIGIPSQGGSQAECQQILTMLGRSGTVGVATRPDDGLGCHVWSNGTLYWLQSPAFDPNAASPSGTGARIACACLQ